MKIGFVGLGVMGGPMARHLVHAGHEVTGFNRSPEKARTWAEATGGRFAATVAEAADGADLLILCVGNDNDVRAVVTEALSHLSACVIVVDHTTTSARIAREMADLATTSGRAFIDAPVSGGQAGAENGQLSVMAGGDEAAHRVRDDVDAFGLPGGSEARLQPVRDGVERQATAGVGEVFRAVASGGEDALNGPHAETGTGDAVEEYDGVGLVGGHGGT